MIQKFPMTAPGSKLHKPATIETESKYTCKACHRSFVLETRFLQHRCNQMKRDDELKSPEGQAAWNFYQIWFKHQKRLALVS